MTTNHEWTRIDQKTAGPPSATSGTKMLLQFGALAVTMSWDEGFLGSAGVPPAPSLAQARPSPLLASTGNGAMALLRPGRWGSRRQGGCLQHRTEAQRRPKGQDAGGTPALPGDPGRSRSYESETTDFCGLSGARTLSGEAGWRQNILFILSIHVNRGSTHARRRDQTPGTSLRDLGVTSCPFVDNPSIGFR